MRSPLNTSTHSRWKKNLCGLQQCSLVHDVIIHLQTLCRIHQMKFPVDLFIVFRDLWCLKLSVLGRCWKTSGPASWSKSLGSRSRSIRSGSSNCTRTCRNPKTAARLSESVCVCVFVLVMLSSFILRVFVNRRTIIVLFSHNYWSSSDPFCQSSQINQFSMVSVHCHRPFQAATGSSWRCSSA